jgi:uncharacterized membrane protein YvlD (DUF360 family)
MSIDDWWSAIVVTLIVGAVNVVVWPIIVRYAAPLIIWSFGLLLLVGNGLTLLIASRIVDGFHVDSFWVAVLASILITGVGAAVGNVLALDDDAVWRRNVIRRMVDKRGTAVHSDVPGVLFMQIDGLSESVLRRGMAEGYLPTLARWVRDGTHGVLGWECDLSSQTGAMQAGILHGSNDDMPAFRWYEKDSRRVLTSNRPADAAEIEARHSDGNGLLVDGGVSRSNVFSGDSDDAMFTFSTVLTSGRHGHTNVTYILADPYMINRILVLSVAEIVREMVARRRAKRRGIEPRGHRGGIYPLLRAATTVGIRDLTVYTLIGDIYRGVPAAYVDFVGYDEVAHHSGIAAPDAMETLFRLDQQLARIEQAIADAPRTYHVVMLADHGQTQGATFLQRYGTSLADVVNDLCRTEADVRAPEFSSEGWGNLSGVLTDAIHDENSRLGRFIASRLKSRTVDGGVVLGPSRDTESGPLAPADVVVLASGNLGLVSFPDLPGRVTLETLLVEHPGLVAGLATHPGIGFVLVRSEELGPIVVGPAGVRYLDDDRVDGVDPLLHFGPNAADHLRRTDSFSNAPDLLVNSFYDPHSDEGAAFEELIGFHGGLGGKQAHPFVMYPKVFSVPDEPLVGAAAIHRLFKGWLADVKDGAVGAPWSVPAPVTDRSVLAGVVTGVPTP